MECKNETCSNEAQGRGSYCSDTCKTVYNRNKKRNTKSVTDETVTQPDVPLDKIAWIKDTLTNTGVGELGTPPAGPALGSDVVNDCPILTPSLLDTLPVGVTRPTGQPNERTKAMTGENLNRRLIGVKVWQQTPEYAEVVHRLLTGKTEGMNLPTWAVA